MTHYGLFENLVLTVSALAATSVAVSLAFTKTARWRPPEESLPEIVPRMAALCTMVALALLYVFQNELGRKGLAWLASGTLAAALLSMVAAVRLNDIYSFYYPSARRPENRRLGGNKLTAEAAGLVATRNQTIQQLFSDAQGDKDLVWTRESQSSVQVRSLLAFIFLIGSGSICVACASMLLLVYQAKEPQASAPKVTTSAVRVEVQTSQGYGIR